MEPISRHVFDRYSREKRTRHSPDDLCRPGFDSNYASWLVLPAASWRWHIWSGPHPLETGVVAVLSGRDFSINFEPLCFSRESFGYSLV